MQVGLHKTYYAASVSHDEAVALLNYLTQEGFFVSDDEVNMHLGKNGSTYELRFIIKTGLENDPETVTQDAAARGSALCRRVRWKPG